MQGIRVNVYPLQGDRKVRYLWHGNVDALGVV